MLFMKYKIGVGYGKNYSKLLWGLVVLAVGVIFTGNVLELWYIDVFFQVGGLCS